MSTVTSTAAETRSPRHPVHRASPLTVGTIVFLASECMFFSGLFATYFTLKAITTGPWPPHDAMETLADSRPRALLFTALLVASSFTMQWGVRALVRGKRVAFRRWILATVVLGVLFLANQFGLEWREAEFSVSSHPFGSLFFTMTGFHGFHVSGGIVAMLVLLARSNSPRFGGNDVPGVEVVSYYWHFVDVVWVIMFSILFFVQ